MAELQRLLAPAAAIELAAAEAACCAHPWSSGMYADSLAGQDQVYVYREEDGTVLGYAVLLLILDEAQLQNIFICQPQQRRGHGRRLLQQLMQLAASQGATRMLLEVRDSNHAARALYAGSGFVECGLRKHYYRTEHGPREHAVLMEAAL
ncbi:ribosomal protein S18-alanine N-acetyltransferase [Vogesella sp. LIG4]|uniref:ribosomal protein S18-alanine N-acetyltransferase n=1 Tax=Vogesella sp. LIG4 TaxID=1192162 RepID=UPI001E53D4EC|nr:ribosomal protein S18-alanine N-acetyltransferase [Vogesella sp. LIG4]